jgi:thiol-disulfide isomerase/thioredoxin
VDGVLVAAPREFGFFGEVEGSGRYAPWRNKDSQARFKTDLARMIDLILAGKKDVVSKEHPATAEAAREIASLPSIALTDLAGKPIAASAFAGRPVLVEFWATWCVPCRSTLQWLGELKKKYGDRLAILALAVESPEDQVKTMTAPLNPELRWAMADAAAARAFGDITSVPTMFVFDGSGKTAKVFYGAPPTLHDDAGKLLDSLIR